MPADERRSAQAQRHHFAAPFHFENQIEHRELIQLKIVLFSPMPSAIVARRGCETWCLHE